MSRLYEKARGSPGAVLDDDQVLRSGRWCTIKVLFRRLVAGAKAKPRYTSEDKVLPSGDTARY